jgi:hypothetical protein
MEWKFIEGSIVKAHQHSCGARKGEEHALGKYSKKILRSDERIK